MNMFQVIRKSCLEPDLNKALLPLQTYMGIDSGDWASVFFSSDNDSRWEKYNLDDRFTILREYIDFEIRSNIDPDEICWLCEEESGSWDKRSGLCFDCHNWAAPVDPSEDKKEIKRAYIEWIEKGE